MQTYTYKKSYYSVTFQRDLIDRGVSSEEKANEVVSEKCLPLVGERQTMFEKQLESMDVSYLLIRINIFVLFCVSRCKTIQVNISAHLDIIIVNNVTLLCLPQTTEYKCVLDCW